jgi:hypothetical protein
MTKSRIIQILALIIFLLGAFLLYDHFINKNESSSFLSGLGATIMGAALLIISKNKMIN